VSVQVADPNSPGNADNSPLRILALGLAVCLLFLRFSMLHQIQTRLMGVNLRLLYIVGIPALVGLVLAGGLQRSFKGRPAYYYTAYAMWMAIAVPFSSWKGGSTQLLWTFLRTDVVMLFAIAGLAVTWKECKLLMSAVAWGAIVNLLSAKLFSNEETFGYRGGLEFGSISNPNDFAGHLLLALPFLLWIAFSSRNFLFRIAALVGTLIGIKLILGTASRGALVALVADVLFFMWRATGKQRIALIMLAPIAVFAAMTLLPAETRNRLLSFSASSAVTNEQKEAVESQMSREYLLRKSLEYIAANPLFGVGPGMFASYEGQHNQIIGTHGSWHETHNSFTQASSECGIPAGCFLIAGIVSTFFLLNKVYRATFRRADCQDLRTAAFCMMLGMVGFTTAITFLNFAYFFYTPAMGGFAILLHHVAQIEIRERDALALAPVASRAF
jgi:hypothetical protein